MGLAVHVEVEPQGADGVVVALPPPHVEVAEGDEGEDGDGREGDRFRVHAPGSGSRRRRVYRRAFFFAAAPRLRLEREARAEGRGEPAVVGLERGRGPGVPGEVGVVQAEGRRGRRTEAPAVGGARPEPAAGGHAAAGAGAAGVPPPAEGAAGGGDGVAERVGERRVGAPVAGAEALLIAWGITGIGIVFLGLSFFYISRLRPDLDGGIYTYAREGFGDLFGFLSAWGYWLCGTIGIVGYLVVAFESVGTFPDSPPHIIFGQGNTFASFIGASIIVWLVHILIAGGIKEAAAVNLVATFVKVSPLILFIVLAAWYFSAEVFHEVRQSLFSAPYTIINVNTPNTVNISPIPRTVNRSKAVSSVLAEVRIRISTKLSLFTPELSCKGNSASMILCSPNNTHRLNAIKPARICQLYGPATKINGANNKKDSFINPPNNTVITKSILFSVLIL